MPGTIPPQWRGPSNFLRNPLIQAMYKRKDRRMNELRKLDSIPDAQAYLGGISRTTLYELAKRRDVQLVNIGRRAFITRESMDAYVAQLTPSHAA